MIATLLIAAASGCVTAAGPEFVNDQWRAKPGDTTPQAEAYAHFLSALLLERQGRHDEALEEMSQVPELDPGALTPTLRMIRAHLRRRDYDAALEMAQQALDQSPERSNLWIITGEIYHQLKRYDEAIAAFSKAIELNPDNVMGYGALVELQESTNDLIAAIDIYHRLIELTPDNAGLHYSLGLNLARTSDTDGAILAFARAIELEPNLSRARYLLGALLLEQDRNKEAIEMLAGYLKRRPNDTKAAENLAGALVREARYAEGMAVIGKLINSRDAGPEHHLFAMYALLREGKPGDAERVAPPGGAPYLGTLMTAIARKDSGQPYQSLVDSLDGFGGDLDAECDSYLGDLLYTFDNDQFGTWFVDELDRFRNSARPSYTLDFIQARTRMFLGEYEAAAALFTPLLKGDASDALLHYHLSICYEELDRFDDTEAALVAYLELVPDDPEIQNFLGYLYAEHGVELDRAEELLNAALASEPENPFFLDSLGWIYYKRGDGPKAVELIQRAIYGMESDDAVLRDHLGDAYLMIGDVERAVAEWERAQRLDPTLEGVVEKIKAHGGNTAS